MGSSAKFLYVRLDEDSKPVVDITKKLEDFEILKTARIKCVDYPSLLEGIDSYILKNLGNGVLKERENLGVLIKGEEGYRNHNPSGYSLKKVIFYRIKDCLD